MKRVFIVLVLFALAACHRGDPVKQLIDNVEKAAEDRNAEKVVSYLSPRFEGNGMARDEMTQMLKQYFFGYRSIEITISDLKIDETKTTADATMHVRFIGVPKEIGGLADILPKSGQYDIAVAMQKEDDGWKVREARWNESAR